MEHQLNKSAFTIVKTQKQIQDYFDMMQQYAKHILESGSKIKIIEYFKLNQFPLFLKTIFNILFYLLIGTTQGTIAKPIIEEIIKNPYSIRIKISLFRIIATIVQKKVILLEPQRYSQQLGFSMIFKNFLLNLFLCTITDNSNFIKVEKIMQLYKRLSSNNYKDSLAVYAFNLYGGSFMKIQKNMFTKKLQSTILSLGRYFTEEETLTNRNIDQISKDKQMKKILESCVLTISNYKNQEYIIQQVERLSNHVFGDDYSLSQKLFIQKIVERKTEEKDLPLNSWLWVYFEMLRLQIKLLECPEFQKEVVKRETVETSKYYLESMQKILKKCPNNGHESCLCKKCQCVRRNRQSAKLAQQKKRNAVEQLGQMQERIQSLQQRNKQLSLFNQIKDHPVFKSILSQAAQPINKVINNDSI